MQPMQPPFPNAPSGSAPNASINQQMPSSSGPLSNVEAVDTASHPFSDTQPSQGAQLPGGPIGQQALGQRMLIPPAGQPVPLPPGVNSGPAAMQAMITAQQRNNRTAPVNKPQGLDPNSLLMERENRFV